MSNFEKTRAPWSANTSSEVNKRVGKSGADLGVSTSSATCPDVLELDNGDYLIIGTDVTEHYSNRLPATVGCGSHERIVMIPAQTLLAASAHLTRVIENYVNN